MIKHTAETESQIAVADAAINARCRVAGRLAGCSGAVVAGVAAFADHIISLGGSRVEDHEAEGFHWTVLADPEGNVFCVSPADH